ncbi:MAG: hypothetical protein COB53_06635 [Elusimicrobia bacterium]|nr:MAG: hypothetical protein COB53_06635 [Elusimicrobiota bacterium]
MLVQLVLAAFTLTASAQVVEHRSTDGAFSLHLTGGRLGRTQGDAVFSWGVGRSVRVSISRSPQRLSNGELLQKTAEDGQALQQKGRHVDPAQLIKTAVAFSLTGFKTTSFGYFNAGSNTYSYLVKGLPRHKAAEILGTLRPAGYQDPPPVTLPPTKLPATLPPANGAISLLNGRIQFPKTQGWRFTAQQDGWTLLEGPDWSFALSARIIENIPQEQKKSTKETAAAYFARFELDFVENKGCQSSAIEGGELVNGWKMLFKTYQCPEMALQRRQVVGILLPQGLPMLGWTGDFDRPGIFSLFEKWLSAGRITPAKAEKSESKTEDLSPFLVTAIGAGLGFSIMILFLISRRRKQNTVSE